MADGNPPQPAPAMKLSPSLPLLASAVAGTPLSVATVSLLNRTIFAGAPMTVEEAVAWGSIGSAVLGYLFHVAEVIINRKVSS